MAEALAAGGEGGRPFSCFLFAAHALPHDSVMTERMHSSQTLITALVLLM